MENKKFKRQFFVFPHNTHTNYALAQALGERAVEAESNITVDCDGVVKILRGFECPIEVIRQVRSGRFAEPLEFAVYTSRDGEKPKPCEGEALIFFLSDAA